MVLMMSVMVILIMVMDLVLQPSMVLLTLTAVSVGTGAYDSYTNRNNDKVYGYGTCVFGNSPAQLGEQGWTVTMKVIPTYGYIFGNSYGQRSTNSHINRAVVMLLVHMLTTVCPFYGYGFDTSAQQGTNSTLIIAVVTMVHTLIVMVI